MAQGLDLELFAAQTLGKSYGNPEPTLWEGKGTYVGECVSYIRQKLSAVEGVLIGSLGNAVDWANDKAKAKLATLGYAWKPGDTAFKDGDILVWGDDDGNWTGKAGHISLWYQGKLLNQNFNGSKRVSKNNFFPAGYLGRYTKKGDIMVSDQDIINLYNGVLATNPSEQEIANYRGKSFAFVFNDIYLFAIKTKRDYIAFKAQTTEKDEYELATVYVKKK